MQLAFDTAFDAMIAGVHRRDRLDKAITAMAADSEFTPVVARLGYLRGVSTLTAFGLAVEIGDWHHRGPYRPSRDPRARWSAAPAAAQARGHAANHRLHDRWNKV